MATFNKIQEIIVDQLGKEEEEVLLTTNFREELEADSLDLFQIINDIEVVFDLQTYKIIVPYDENFKKYFLEKV